ncbi:MAG: VanZ family protein [Oscillospiraceae bacterium]|nr:VanZ family protein [Oscillospiraceae bacterium]
MTTRRLFSLAFWLSAAIAIAVAIFLFSSQPAEISNETSKGALRKLLEFFLGESTEALIREYNHPLRKVAHFTLYAMLGFSLTGVFQHQKRVHKMPLAVLLSAGFAALDEFHQSFVPGRGPQMTDVLLDTAGAATGAVLMTLILLLLYRNAEKPSR